MLNRHSTLKHAWIFYPLAFLIFVLPYGWPINLPKLGDLLGAWRFVLASLALMACAAVFFRKTWTAVLGFPKRVSQIIACLFSGIVAFLVFYFFIDSVLSYGGYQQLPFTNIPSGFFGRYPLLCRTLWRICQPLNEEIVLRALLLGFFARFFSHRAYLAIIAALIFSGLHLLIYYFGQMDVQLDLLALLTLFFFALVANALYLTFNHIGFGLVIHIAWNWWRFSGDIVKDGVVLNEAQTFNVLEGSVPVFIFVTVASLACVLGLMIHDVKIKRKLSAETSRR
jgi:membrane protease YdiL (CAAX protease family)